MNGVKMPQVTLLADTIHVLVVSGIQREHAWGFLELGGGGGAWIFKFFPNSNVPQGNNKTAAITGRADLCFRATHEKREAKVDRKRRSFGEKEEELL